MSNNFSLHSWEGILRGRAMPGDIRCGETTAGYIHRKFQELIDERDSALAQQPAPVAVPDDLRRDEAYRNGLMAGFGFGLKGDEAGYATALAGYSREIHEARAILAAAPAAPVAVGQEPIKLSDDVREFLQEWIDSTTGGEDSDVDYDFANQLAVLLGPIYSAPPASGQPDAVRVPVETLQHIHRDLDACQKVIWLAGCRPFGYGFDPAYVTEAQARLKEIDALLSKEATHA